MEISRPRFVDVQNRDWGTSESEQALRRVVAAREFAKDRMAQCGVPTNSRMTHRHVRTVVQPDGPGRELLRRAFDGLGLSMRAYDRVLKVARSIADLEGSTEVRADHIAEAIQYRIMDRPLKDRV